MQPPTKYNISCDSYKKNMCNGFSDLQQREEFVDMTLAAEGHFVKVHKNLIALASPFLKEILKSAPCQHPIIFLTHISQKTLSYLLEYIYTGEVQVPMENMNSFIEACKYLHLAGVEDLIHTQTQFSSTNVLQPTTSEKPEENEDNYYAAHITINDINELDVHHFGNEQLVHNRNKSMNQVTTERCGIDSSTVSHTIGTLVNSDYEVVDTANNLEIPQSASLIDDSHLNFNNSICTNQSEGQMSVEDTMRPRYTVSNRGSLQLIFNDFMYSNHHTANGGRKRRWRCIDYRSIQCPAFIDTDGETIVNRECLHLHPSHETKIMNKVQQNLVYTSITMATKESINNRERDTYITFSITSP
ncbi:transcription factor GAGA-like isoform X3 [Achroia grisella]|uniref:transcription factor GAGA-like isoform X3 n=1 Tax=Achroia grisella TaxID=688607 RepID=UPI0027D2673D|nr:transcription factor GAGA-like isoform X3 [Achroia grisella]